MNAVEDKRYRQSSQFRLWSHTQRQLASLRAQTNRMAVSQISTRLLSTAPEATAAAAAAATTANSSTSAPGNGSTQPSLPEFLTAEEELQLLRFSTVELLKAGEFCKMPTEARATAAIFFRRFYVTNSVMTYSTRDIMKTCLFFDMHLRTTMTYILTDARFAQMFPDTTEEEVLAGEFLLSQGIRFCFDVRHPFRALNGAILELNRLDKDQKDKRRIEEAHIKTRSILKFSPILTDAYFHFTPSQIMYAALSMVDHELARRLLDGSFAHASSVVSEDDKERLDDLQEKILATVESCREMLEAETPERQEEWWTKPECAKQMRPLVRKLKKCRDPDRADLVALQRARREQAHKKEKARTTKDDDVFGPAHAGTRDAKRRKVSSVVDDQFGPTLG